MPENKCILFPAHDVMFKFIKMSGGQKQGEKADCVVSLFGDDGYVYGVSGENARQMIRLACVEISKVKFTVSPCRDGGVVLKSDNGLIKAIVWKDSIIRGACA